MFNFNKEKYHIFTNNKDTVVVTSTYCGKKVKGTAHLDPLDKFDLETGTELAMARCNLKVATRRKARANKKLKDAAVALNKAREYYLEMTNYFLDASVAYDSADEDLIAIESSMLKQ